MDFPGFLPKIPAFPSIPFPGGMKTPHCSEEIKRDIYLWNVGPQQIPNEPRNFGIGFQQTSLIPPQPRGFGKAGKQQEFRAPPGHFVPFKKNVLGVCYGNIQEFGLKVAIRWNLPGIESLSPISPPELIPWAGSLLFPGFVLPGFSHVSQHRIPVFVFCHGSFPTGWKLTHFQQIGN